MKDKPLNHEESLKVIHQMIEASKARLQDNGFIWLMWGWFVLIASLSQYTMLQLEQAEYSWIGWMLMPVGGIITAIYSIKQKNKTSVTTHVDQFMNALWTAFGIAIVITIVFVMPDNRASFLPFCMILYGIGTYVSGSALRFAPLRYGALISFGCAVAAFQVTYPTQLLCIALAITASYIVPGHMLNARFKKENA